MINLEGAMALDFDASAVAARVFNRSGTSKRRASAVQSTRSTLAHAPLAALGLMQLQRRVGAASRAFDQSTVELPFKLAGSTAGIRENPDPIAARRPAPKPPDGGPGFLTFRVYEAVTRGLRRSVTPGRTGSRMIAPPVYQVLQT
jgi:hypothetical protein